MNIKFFQRNPFALAAALTVLLSAVAASDAHEDELFIQDRQPPFQPGGGGVANGNEPIIAFPSSGMYLKSWLPVGSLDPNSTSGNDCWGYVSPSGREYAIIGLSASTAFVEITVPTDPVVVAVIPGPNSLWRDIKTYQTYAYAVSEGGGGIQVMDLSQIDAGIVTHVQNVTTGGSTQTHNVAIDEASGYLYRTGGGSNLFGIRVYDLNADPAGPTFVGQWNDRYFHDVQVVTMTSGPFAGQQIAIGFSESQSNGGNPGVDILNVTDKGNITPISFFQYSTPVFSHQGWLSPDRQYLYIDDELDERNTGVPTTTRIIDVSDLTMPMDVGTFTNGNSSIDHNLYTLGNLIFEANYRSGIRIYDATNPAAPLEIAYFDTYPDDDNAFFNGLWNNYPYLPSGIVFGSDLEKGLFVWAMGEPALSFAFPSGMPDLVSPSGATITVQIDELSPGSFQPGSAKLHLDTGAGFVETDLTPLGGLTFEATIGAGLECGTQIQYFFSAETTDGTIWREPQTAPIASYNGLVADAYETTFADDLESDQGWIVGAPSDTAASGIWTRVDPIGTAAQPENDHTDAAGVTCFVTGQGLPDGDVGDEDVDGGTTTLTSPAFDATQDAVYVTYWRWFSNSAGSAPHEDTFVVEISNDDGATWSTAEVVGPSGLETNGGWFYHQFLVSAVIAPTPTMRMRFLASDAMNGSIVEAAVDDFAVVSLNCFEPCAAADGDLNLDGAADGQDVRWLVDGILNGAAQPALCAGDFSANGALDLADVAGFVDTLIGP